MINLLPPQTKQNFAYARRNTHLLRWLAGLGVGLAGIALITTAGTFVLERATTGYHTSNRISKRLSDSDVAVQQQVSDISNNLKLAVKVLSRQVLFSELLNQIGAVLPRGVILVGLTISQTTGGIDLDAAASDYQAGSQAQVNLADPANKLFSKADLISIQCQPDGASGLAFSASHPCRLQIRAQFANNTPFLLINKGAGK